jgi:hypothetical protein
MTALVVLRRKREAELSRAKQVLEHTRRVHERCEAARHATAQLVSQLASPPLAGQILDVVREATRQAQLARLRTLLQQQGIAAADEAARLEQARAAVGVALRAMRAVEVLEQRARQPEIDRRRRREAAETEDRNRK